LIFFAIEFTKFLLCLLQTVVQIVEAGFNFFALAETGSLHKLGTLSGDGKKMYRQVVDAMDECFYRVLLLRAQSEAGIEA